MRLATFFVAAWLLTSSADAGHSTTWRYKVQKPSTGNYACVQIRWMPQEEIIKRYGAAGITFVKRKNDGTPQSDEWQLMIVPLPTDGFNDHRSMEILGHELYHALGADHD